MATLLYLSSALFFHDSAKYVFDTCLCSQNDGNIAVNKFFFASRTKPKTSEELRNKTAFILHLMGVSGE
jgi:hypothetical protein